MSRICQITGKKAMRGHHVSHANNRVPRRFEVNLHHRRFWSESKNRWIRLCVSSAAMRLIDRDGIDAFIDKSCLES